MNISKTDFDFCINEFHKINDNDLYCEDLSIITDEQKIKIFSKYGINYNKTDCFSKYDNECVNLNQIHTIFDCYHEIGHYLISDNKNTINYGLGLVVINNKTDKLATVSVEIAIIEEAAAQLLCLILMFLDRCDYKKIIDTGTKKEELIKAEKLIIEKEIFKFL
jgi:hypothetical protein